MNTFAYLAVNFAFNFPHERSERGKVSRPAMKMGYLSLPMTRLSNFSDHTVLTTNLRHSDAVNQNECTDALVIDGPINGNLPRPTTHPNLATHLIHNRG